MPSLTIKNLPESLYSRLKEQARLHRRSLNSEVIACLETLLLPTTVEPDEYLARLDELQRRLDLTPPNETLLADAKADGRP